jgi:hypothetical protein
MDLEYEKAWAVELIDTYELIRTKDHAESDSVDRETQEHWRICGFEVARLARAFGLYHEGPIESFHDRNGKLVVEHLEDIDVSARRVLEKAWEPDALRVAIDDHGILHLELGFAEGEKMHMTYNGKYLVYWD